MQVEKYLKEYQPIIYQTFLNSLSKNAFSHAYLLSGNPGTPLLEVAKYLAKTVLCDSPSPLACSSCITCLRIDNNYYPDFIVIDGEKSTIKKDNVTNIETQFEKKAFEAKGIMVYILHLVENMTIEAINSILKFLEEPESNIYAFLTTNNENSILPTIISRCQCLRLKNIDRQIIIDKAIEEYEIERVDAELLSYFYNDPELIQERIHLEHKDIYFDIKDILEGLLEAFKDNNPDEIIYYAQTKIAPLLDSKENARFFFDILLEIYEDILAIQHQKDIVLTSYASILRPLADTSMNVEAKILEILKSRNLISSNVNIALLIDHLFFKLTERV